MPASKRSILTWLDLTWPDVPTGAIVQVGKGVHAFYKQIFGFDASRGLRYRYRDRDRHGSGQG